MFRTISLCGHHMIRAEDEQTLAQAICTVMVKDGGYRMAWVGLAENDAARSIRAVACAGIEIGYLEDLNLTWADTDCGSGPGARCIREQTVQVTRDITNDARFMHWRAEAARRGYASSIALPLTIGTQTRGFLGIYSEQRDAFGEDETSLLPGAADDLVYGITAQRDRRERDALKELAHRAEEAEAATRAKSALLAHMSHEIRTPINAIIGLTHLLARDTRDPLQSSRLAKVDGAAQHLLRLINDVLDLSKIEAGKMALESTGFSLDRLLEQTFEMVAGCARERSGTRAGHRPCARRAAW